MGICLQQAAGITHEGSSRTKAGRRANGRASRAVQCCRWRLLELIVSYTGGASGGLRPCSVTCKTAQPKRQHPSSKILLGRPRFPVCRYGIDRAVGKWEREQKRSSEPTYLTGVAIYCASCIGHDDCFVLLCRREFGWRLFFLEGSVGRTTLARAPLMRAAAKRGRKLWISRAEQLSSQYQTRDRKGTKENRKKQLRRARGGQSNGASPFGL